MNSEEILRELRRVKKKQEGKTYRTFEINIGAMAQDCIDVIEDLNKQIEIMKIEIKDKNFVIDRMFVNINEDPTAIFAAEMLKIQADNEEHNALLKKMRAELRGDICE